MKFTEVSFEYYDYDEDDRITTNIIFPSHNLTVIQILDYFQKKISRMRIT